MNKLYLLSTTTMNNIDVVAKASEFKNKGADGILFMEDSTNDKEHDANIGALIEIKNTLDIIFYVSGNVKRLEDVKKYLYAGAAGVVIENDNPVKEEAIKRFGEDKVLDPSDIKVLTQNEITFLDEASTGLYVLESENYYEIKSILDGKNIKTTSLKPKFSFSDLKTIDMSGQKMVPVIVQDYRTSEVLMSAYMNEEAFDKTVYTGKMTYFSRSRSELWVKGETSDHYQYVKELIADCDKDVILAKVHQIGAACHTGNRTCFFNEICKADYNEENPMKVFENVYDVIMDRKNNPKEGSYTNYLFDKGIDKILKKVGEEATEIVIAAKNPDPQEIKYEISDFLYHVMVLMAEKGVSWDDITEELSRR